MAKVYEIPGYCMACRSTFNWADVEVEGPEWTEICPECGVANMVARGVAPWERERKAERLPDPPEVIYID